MTTLVSYAGAEPNGKRCYLYQDKRHVGHPERAVFAPSTSSCRPYTGSPLPLSLPPLRPLPRSDGDVQAQIQRIDAQLAVLRGAHSLPVMSGVLVLHNRVMRSVAAANCREVNQAVAACLGKDATVTVYKCLECNVAALVNRAAWDADAFFAPLSPGVRDYDPARLKSKSYPTLFVRDVLGIALGGGRYDTIVLVWRRATPLRQDVVEPFQNTWREYLALEDERDTSIVKALQSATVDEDNHGGSMYDID